MPSVLYIFIRASNIPRYCRFDGSTPALYCSTSRVFVTHIGFVIERVMAPENRWKLDLIVMPTPMLVPVCSVLCNTGFYNDKTTYPTRVLILCKQAKFTPTIVPSLCLQCSQSSPTHCCWGYFCRAHGFLHIPSTSLFCLTFHSQYCNL